MRDIKELLETLATIPVSTMVDERTVRLPVEVTKYVPGVSRAKELDFGSRGTVGLMCGLGKRFNVN